MSIKFEELAKRVEAGELTKWHLKDAFGLPNTADNTMMVSCALNGSLDAAKSLHEAVLPDWDADISKQQIGHWSTYAGWSVEISNWGKDDILGQASAFAKEPGTAWVAAILRAKGSEDE